MQFDWVCLFKRLFGVKVTVTRLSFSLSARIEFLLCRMWTFEAIWLVFFFVNCLRFSLQVMSAQAEGRLIEMFGAGTAAIVSPVGNIYYNDKLNSIPVDASPTAVSQRYVGASLFLVRGCVTIKANRCVLTYFLDCWVEQDNESPFLGFSSITLRRIQLKIVNWGLVLKFQFFLGFQNS